MSISDLMLTQDDIVIVGGTSKLSCKEDLSRNTNDYDLGVIKIIRNTLLHRGKMSVNKLNIKSCIL